MSAYCHESNPSATAGCTRTAGHEGEHQAVSGETWERRIDWSVCHCGRNADGHLMGYCAHCSSVRCDAYPGVCGPYTEQETTR